MKSKRNRPRGRYRRTYERPTPETLEPKIRRQVDDLINDSDLSTPEIFRKLSFGGLGVSFATFRGYVYRCRRDAGMCLGRWQRNDSQVRAGATADIVFLERSQ